MDTLLRLVRGDLASQTDRGQTLKMGTHWSSIAYKPQGMVRGRWSGSRDSPRTDPKDGYAGGDQAAEADRG